MDAGEEQLRRQRQEELIDTGTPRDERMGPSNRRDGFLRRMRDEHTGSREIGPARQNEGRPARQRPADGFERLATHDQRASQSQRFETGEILRNPPREGVPPADDVVGGDSGDDPELRHTATGALIAGCGS